MYITLLTEKKSLYILLIYCLHNRIEIITKEKEGVFFSGRGRRTVKYIDYFRGHSRFFLSI